MTGLALAIALIVVPVVFTAAYALLGVTFSYPAILRRPAAEVLERFEAGGTRLILLWWIFALTPLVFIPIAVGLGSSLPEHPLTSLTVTIGVLAGVVQAVGLIRWPFLVPHLVRTRHESPQIAEALFNAANRFLGIAIGEHLGYLLTGSWTILLSVSLLDGSSVPAWFAVVGIVIGVALLFGALEFVGRWEREGWHLAGTVVAIAYTAWSLWLIGGGVLLLL